MAPDASADDRSDHGVETGAVSAAREDTEAHGRQPYPTVPNRPVARMVAVLAINGFLEWFFLGLLTFLVVAVTVFGLFVAIQFFRNPGRKPRR